MNATLILPPIMLAASNMVMNYAWYGHLKSPQRLWWAAVLISWAIAFFEYCLAVPANRLGSRVYSLAELKTMQEVMSLATFVIMAWWLFGQRPGPSQFAGFALIAGGAFLIFKSPFG